MNVKGKLDPRVMAIRNNELVGNGTCSVVSECFSDNDLSDELNRSYTPIETPEQAVKWAISLESAHMEQSLNSRMGEDVDPELKDYRDWHERRKLLGF